MQQPSTSKPSSTSEYQTLLAGLAKCSEVERFKILRWLCKSDLFFLLVFVCKRQDANRQWILERCREVEESPNGMLDLWAREHYKSTIITFALTIQNILNNPEVTCCILSYNRPTAKAFLRQIKEELENNEQLKAWFPDILYPKPQAQSPKWSENEGLIVRRQSNPREATVEAYGLVDGMPTGRHYGILVYDDVVTEHSVSTPDQIQKTTQRWELSTNLGSESGIRRYIGTRYDDMDTYSTMLERGVATPRIHAATDNGQLSGVPVLLSAGYIAEKRLNMSEYIFSCQMLLNPVVSDNAFFDITKIHRYRRDEKPHQLSVYAASDYATKDNAGDWTVHIIVGVDSQQHIWVLDLWRAQSQSDVWVESAIDLMKTWQPVRWFEENSVINKSIGPFLVQRMRERKAFIPRSPVSVATNKAARARSIQGRIQMGMVHVPSDAEWADDLMLELRRFPNTNVDDQVDTIAFIGMGLEQIYGPMEVVEIDRPDPVSSAEAILTSLRKKNIGKYSANFLG